MIPQQDKHEMLHLTDVSVRKSYYTDLFINDTRFDYCQEMMSTVKTRLSSVN